MFNLFLDRSTMKLVDGLLIRFLTFGQKLLQIEEIQFGPYGKWVEHGFALTFGNITLSPWTRCEPISFFPPYVGSNIYLHCRRKYVGVSEVLMELDFLPSFPHLLFYFCCISYLKNGWCEPCNIVFRGGAFLKASSKLTVQASETEIIL